MRDKVILVRLNDKENGDLEFLAKAWCVSKAEALRTLLKFEMNKVNGWQQMEE